MKQIVFFFSFFFLSLPMAFAEAKRPVVVEYFTSSLCQSCSLFGPILDSLLLSSTQKNSNLFVIEHHVDALDSLREKDRDVNPQSMVRYEEFRSSLGKVIPGSLVINGKHVVTKASAVTTQRRILTARKARSKAKAVLSLRSEWLEAERSARIFYTVKGLERVRREFFYVKIFLLEDRVLVPVGESAVPSKVVRHILTQRVTNAPTEEEAVLVLPVGMQEMAATALVVVEDPRTGSFLGAENIKLVVEKEATN